MKRMTKDEKEMIGGSTQMTNSISTENETLSAIIPAQPGFSVVWLMCIAGQEIPDVYVNPIIAWRVEMVCKNKGDWSEEWRQKNVQPIVSRKAGEYCPRTPASE